MNKKIHTDIEVRDFGNRVVCDVCSEDWTNRTESGGFLFGSYAYCPKCATIRIDGIRAYGEESNIKLRCPPVKSFAKWVLEDLRQGNNEIRMITKELR